VQYFEEVEEEKQDTNLVENILLNEIREDEERAKKSLTLSLSLKFNI
jgi:hypothetical protein